ncbi:MAG: hypothetical protein HQK50_17825 [Oligoflexia bacterium]|nr:hypothetical protein [Oligoflexia bacterium]MBF0367437.1 hypothetical protein [Oligoflexia bacterium]
MRVVLERLLVLVMVILGGVLYWEEISSYLQQKIVVQEEQTQESSRPLGFLVKSVYGKVKLTRANQKGPLLPKAYLKKGDRLTCFMESGDCKIILCWGESSCLLFSSANKKDMMLIGNGDILLLAEKGNLTGIHQGNASYRLQRYSQKSWLRLEKGDERFNLYWESLAGPATVVVSAGEVVLENPDKTLFAIKSGSGIQVAELKQGEERVRSVLSKFSWSSVGNVNDQIYLQELLEYVKTKKRLHFIEKKLLEKVSLLVAKARQGLLTAGLSRYRMQKLMTEQRFFVRNQRGQRRQ